MTPIHKALLSGTLALILGTNLSCNTPVHARDQAVKTFTLTVIGTNDFHGRVHRLPWFAGYLNNLRRQINPENHGVLLVDAGDMFQGTLESNLNEGAIVVDAYNALGYHGVTIGNHEYDFGPVGPLVSAQHPEDDPRGALRARAKQARFPFLAANTVESSTGNPPAWDNVHPTALLHIGGMNIGLIGVTTTDTPSSTVAANVVGLRFTPLAKSIEHYAKKLRNQGAMVVIVLAHEGGLCHHVTNSVDTSSCDLRKPIAKVASALEPGLVNVIVAGHTHQTIAHIINHVPIIESWSNGRGFGRVDLQIDRTHRTVLHAKVYPPQPICKESRGETCTPEPYAGAPVHPDPHILKVIAPAIEYAASRKQRSLNVTVEQTLRREYNRESALGNFVTDMMLKAQPKADLAIINAGALRVNLTKGPLTYGKLYEVHPFDNNFALISLTGTQLKDMLLRNLKSAGGMLSLAGVQVQASCKHHSIEILVQRPNGKVIEDHEIITVATSDFLATGGDDIFRRKHLAPNAA